MALRNYVFSNPDEISLCFRNWAGIPHKVVVTDISAHKRMINYKNIQLFLHLPRMHFYTFIFRNECVDLGYNGSECYNSLVFLFENEYHYACLPNIDIAFNLRICGSELNSKVALDSHSHAQDFAFDRLSYFFSSEFNNGINLLKHFTYDYDYNLNSMYCRDVKTDYFMFEWSRQTKINKGLEFIPKVKLNPRHQSWFNPIFESKSFVDKFF
jgi:hypothetical protein